MNEETLSSERLYSGRVVSLRLDTVALSGDRTFRREIVEHAPVVVIAPIDDLGRLHLVRQYRKPAEEVLLELPAGGVDEGESLEKAVHRELAEETGRRAGRLIPLGAFYSAPGYCTELMHLFLATGLVEGQAEPEEDEAIEIVTVSAGEARRLIRTGQIRDAKSIAGIYRVLDYLAGDPE